MRLDPSSQSGTPSGPSGPLGAPDLPAEQEGLHRLVEHTGGPGPSPLRVPPALWPRQPCGPPAGPGRQARGRPAAPGHTEVCGHPDLLFLPLCLPAPPPPLRFPRPSDRKYSQHPDSGEPGRHATLFCCTGRAFSERLTDLWFPFLSLPTPFRPRVAAEVGRSLDTTRIHLSSVPPASEGWLPLLFAPGTTLPYAPSTAWLARGPAQPCLLGCRASGTRGPGALEAWLAAAKGNCPPPHVSPPPWRGNCRAAVPCTATLPRARTSRGCAHARTSLAYRAEPRRAPSHPLPRGTVHRPTPAACLPPPA